MPGVTNKGKARILNGFFRNTSVPTTFYLCLVTSGVAPTIDSNTKSQFTEIALGNGYPTAGGIAVARNTTDFDYNFENDTTDKGELQLKDIIFTAAGGNLPSSGPGARYALLTDDNGTVADREVLAWFDLASDRTVSDTQTLTITNAEIDLTE